MSTQFQSSYLNSGMLPIYFTSVQLQDLEEAAASRVADPEALYWVGYCFYRQSGGAHKDFDTAAVYFTRAANLSNGKALFRLGECFKWGRGVNKDKERAAEYFSKAIPELKAEASASAYVVVDAEAQYLLGDAYHNGGRGVEDDEAVAVEWYQKAANVGHVNAQHAVADCLQYGWGVEHDLIAAIGWYGQAARQNYEPARNALSKLYKQNAGLINKVIREALTQEDDYLSACALAYCYQEGVGVPENQMIAQKWEQQAEGAPKEKKIPTMWLPACLQMEKDKGDGNESVFSFVQPQKRPTNNHHQTKSPTSSRKQPDRAASTMTPPSTISYPQKKRYDVIPPGTTVSVIGMEEYDNPKSHGKNKVIGYDVATGMYKIQVADPDAPLLRVEPEHVLQCATVKITGVVSQPELNGKTGTISSWNPSRERYILIRDDTGKQLSLKPTNVAILNDSGGAEVIGQIVNHSSSPKLNGQLGQINSYNNLSGQYEVQLGSNQVVKVGLDNVLLYLGGANKPAASPPPSPKPKSKSFAATSATTAASSNNHVSRGARPPLRRVNSTGSVDTDTDTDTDTDDEEEQQQQQKQAPRRGRRPPLRRVNSTGSVDSDDDERPRSPPATHPRRTNRRGANNAKQEPAPRRRNSHGGPISSSRHKREAASPGSFYESASLPARVTKLESVYGAAPSGSNLVARVAWLEACLDVSGDGTLPERLDRLEQV